MTEIARRSEAFRIGFFEGMHIADEYISVKDKVRISAQEFFEDYVAGMKMSPGWKAIEETVRRLAGYGDPRTLDELYQAVDEGLSEGFQWELEDYQTHDLKQECPHVQTVNHPMVEDVDIEVCVAGRPLRPFSRTEALRFVERHKNTRSVRVLRKVVYEGDDGIVIQEREIDRAGKRHTHYWGFSDDIYALIYDVESTIGAEGLTEEDAVWLLTWAMEDVRHAYKKSRRR